MQGNRHRATRPSRSRTDPLLPVRDVLRGASIAMLWLLALPVLLLAHAHLRRSEPSARERLTTPPRAIRLWFSENPQLAFTRVRLLTADSSEVALGPLAPIENDASGVSAPIVEAVVSGTYTVLWQTGGADGHPSRGSFRFTVTPGEEALTPAAAVDTPARRRDDHAVVQVDATSEPPTFGAFVGMRWAELISIIAVLGVIAFRLVVLPRAGVAVNTNGDGAELRSHLPDAARRFGLGWLVLAAIAAVVRLYGEASLMLGPGAHLDRAALWHIVGDSAWGSGWLVGIAGVAIAAVGLWTARRASVGWPIAALGALLLAIGPAMTGHAAVTKPAVVSIAADVLHIVAAGMWLGALLVIVAVSIPTARSRGLAATAGLAPLIRAFHPLALAGSVTVIASGLVSAWLRLPTVGALWSGAYGRVLLTKIAVVAGVVAIGALNWRRLLPRLDDANAARTLRRTAAMELSLAAGVVLLTALLVSLPTPELPGRVVPDETASASPVQP